MASVTTAVASAEAANRAWRSEQKHTKPTVLRLVFPEALREGWEQWIFISSDRHHDNLHCRHEREKRDLDLARERNAIILDFGDLFCAMQGKWDRRADQDQLREELHGNNYLDKLVAYNADFYAPYSDLFGLVTLGNHESAILKRHQTDILDRMTERIAANTGHRITAGGYTGWIQMQFKRPGQRVSRRKTIYYTHGYGGGGPVTKDTIQANRQMSYLSDVDAVMSAHTHDQWVVPHQVAYLDRMGNPQQRKVMMIKCGGYKDEFSPGEGWHNETGKPPKPLGGVWCRMYYYADNVHWEFTTPGQ